MRKSLKDRFIEQYPQIHLSGNFPNGGFITPHGSVIPAYGNHEAMVQAVKGTLKGLIQSGIVRFHVYRQSVGFDVPKRITEDQFVTISRILKDTSVYHCVTMRTGSRQAKHFGVEHAEMYTSWRVINYLRGTNET